MFGVARPELLARLPECGQVALPHVASSRFWSCVTRSSPAKALGEVGDASIWSRRHVARRHGRRCFSDSVTAR